MNQHIDPYTALNYPPPHYRGFLYDGFSGRGLTLINDLDSFYPQNDQIILRLFSRDIFIAGKRCRAILANHPSALSENFSTDLETNIHSTAMIDVVFDGRAYLHDYGLAQTSYLTNFLGLDSPQEIVIKVPEQVPQLIKELLFQPFDGTLYRHFAFSKITEVLCYLAYYLKRPCDTPFNPAKMEHILSRVTAKALNLMDQKLAEFSSIKSIAMKIGVSTGTLTTTFKREMSESLSSYLLRQKMETAQLLLHGGNLSVMDVALAVGYDDQSGFGRAYKRYFQHPPKFDKRKNG